MPPSPSALGHLSQASPNPGRRSRVPLARRSDQGLVGPASRGVPVNPCSELLNPSMPRQALLEVHLLVLVLLRDRSSSWSTARRARNSRKSARASPCESDPASWLPLPRSSSQNIRACEWPTLMEPHQPSSGKCLVGVERQSGLPNSIECGECHTRMGISCSEPSPNVCGRWEMAMGTIDSNRH
jgi:hypothetical protein